MATKKRVKAKSERLSGFYKEQMVQALIKVLDAQGLSRVQMRRIFSFGYQSLRTNKKERV